MDISKDLALVGAGYWGRNLARNFNELGALHSLCDADPSILDSYDSDYLDVAKVTSFDTILSNPEIHRVAIATPATTHFQLAKLAILANKDVYVEKPLCLDSQEAAELIQIAEKNQRILMVGHLLRYHPFVEKLTEMVQAGDLGKLLYITSNRLNLGKIRQEENSLWSFAPHDISVILALAGELPAQVVCHGESYLTDGVADTTLTQLKFSSGLRAHVYVSWLNPFKEQKLTVVGSEGMAVFDDTLPWEQKLIIYRDYLTWTDGKTPKANKNIGETIVVEKAEPLRSECLHFLDSCARRTKARTCGEEGLRVLRVLNAAQSSLDENGEAISLATLDCPSHVNDYFVHPTAVIDDGASIGRGTSVWHFSHVSAKSILGQGCNLGQNVFVASGVTIGQNVKIQNNVSIYAGTIIEDNVFLGPSCVLTNVTNPRSEINRKGIYEKTLIRRGATIGANATVVCGVTIGRYAFVAAGAVVTRDIPDYGYVRGVPSKQVGWMSRHGHVLDFSQSKSAVCPESNLQYQLDEDNLSAPTVRCVEIDEEQSLDASLRVGSKPYNSFRHD